ncbi:protein SMAX1-LIKE 6-like [Tasmannia lanceolata]|uniref:protein SMAX1-LIKE 6-like n=1 Tax=Tasmannia lanceolata TaxID=3420 RepID=UPI0040629F2C
MPTPVSSARQCLTNEAARAIEEAVGVARRRGHAQTTSFHAVSALLTLPSSALREACTRARSSAYSHRLQLRALELCICSALDRLPSSQTLEEPPISNSLMAAIKRSQAIQRRNPDSYHFIQQHQNPQQSSLLSVRVELKQLIISILDDPVVSRVFGEAGFRNYDVKLNIMRPPFVKLRPPLFLCNFNFPFVEESDEYWKRIGDCRRIGEVLCGKMGRNPLLIGVSARDAVRNFADCLQRKEGFVGSVLPQEISRVKFICIEQEVMEIGGPRRGDSGFSELGRLAEQWGVIVSVGDLKGFFVDKGRFMVGELTRLLDVHRGRLWLIGTVMDHETYMKFLACYPSVEKDWDLQVLTFTSVSSEMGGFYSRRNSLMESFVPFGGFFSTVSDLKIPVNSVHQSVFRCHLCNEKYEEELSTILKGPTVAASDLRKASLPSWLQSAGMISMNTGLDVAKAKEDGKVMNAKVMELQKKWNDICQHHHRSSQMHEADIYGIGAQVLPGIAGLPYVTDRKERADSQNMATNVSQDHNAHGNCISMSMDLQKISSPHRTIPASGVSESVKTDLVLGIVDASLCKEQKQQSVQTCKERLKDLSGCLPTEFDAVSESLPIVPVVSSSCSSFSDQMVPNTHLPMRNYPGSNAMKSNVASDMNGQIDPRDFKMLWRGLIEKVGYQDEAICAINQAIVRCKLGNERCRGASLKGDIWLSFHGPDRVAKRKIALALADMMFGSRENIICVDVTSQDRVSRPNTIFDLGQEMNGYDLIFTGKSVVEYIAAELIRKPRSVVFLENVDKADSLLQSSLSQTVKKGKLTDSHGREIGLNNAIFVTTAREVKGKETLFTGKDCVSFSEERILAAQDWQMQILIGHISDTTNNNSSNVLVIPQNESKNKQSTSSQVFINKRKLGECDEKPHSFEVAKRAHRTSNTYLDLNLPIEEIEEPNHLISTTTLLGDDVSVETEGWLEEFSDSVDHTVIFKPFDFDTLADNVLKKISEIFQKIIGSEGTLEIDSKVMEQILAAVWLSDGMRALEDWVEQVLGESFAEARQRYRSLSGHLVLKLVTCDERFKEAQAPGVCLPARVILN